MWCDPIIYFCFCFLCFWCTIQKIITKTNVKELIAYVSSRSFMISDVTFISLIHLSDFCVWCNRWVQFHSFVCSSPAFLIPFIEETIFSPLYILGISCCSVTKSCPTFCNSTDCSVPSFPVLHYLPEFAQIHVPSRQAGGPSCQQIPYQTETRVTVFSQENLLFPRFWTL